MSRRNAYLAIAEYEMHHCIKEIRTISERLAGLTQICARTADLLKQEREATGQKQRKRKRKP